MFADALKVSTRFLDYAAMLLMIPSTAAGDTYGELRLVIIIFILSISCPSPTQASQKGVGGGRRKINVELICNRMSNELKIRD